MSRSLSYGEALKEATAQEMRRDPSIIVLGMGVDDFQGIYGTTKDLAAEFGRLRVFDTPLSEDGMTGIAIGAALGGLRPIHVHIRMDFLLLAMNQIVNVAAKARYMYGGAVSVPIVIRAIIGRSWGQGAQHSQGLHSFFMHVPGLRVAAPTTPHDAKGCLISAIRGADPVIFVEHRLLHPLHGAVPEASYESPIGKGRVLAPGRDVTLVGISHMAVECLRARAMLADSGIDAEVVDPVWLSPLDMITIVESARKTGKLMVVDSGWTTCGASAEILARTAEQLQEHGPRLQRLGFAPVSCPTTRNLEDLFYPDARRIAESAYALVRGRAPSWPASTLLPPEIVDFRGPF
jgi:pyruvate/2-oxoglutarate/acetoin dehydrogenase E1 component